MIIKYLPRARQPSRAADAVGRLGRSRAARARAARRPRLQSGLHVVVGAPRADTGALVLPRVQRSLSAAAEDRVWGAVRQRAERHAHSPNLAIRVHRSLSWLNRAEQADDLDGRYVFLWIAFNAAYATEIDDQQRLSEQETFKAFLAKLSDLDQQNALLRSDTQSWLSIG